MQQSAVIYARVSSSSDRQDTTRQVEDLKRYAEANQLSVVKVFEEHISGAKKIEERAVLTECLDYCTSHSVKFLLLSELSRLGRSTLQVLRSLERLHEAGVSVFIQNLGIYSCNKQTYFVLFFVKLIVHFAGRFRGSLVPVYY